jgi:hypothetical protein
MVSDILYYKTYFFSLVIALLYSFLDSLSEVRFDKAEFTSLRENVSKTQHLAAQAREPKQI